MLRLVIIRNVAHIDTSHIIAYLHLDLDPRVPAATLGDERSPLLAITSNRSCILPADIRHLYVTSYSVSCYAFFPT